MKNENHVHHRRRGFTLVEVLAALALVVVVAALLAANLPGMLQSGKVQAARQAVKTSFDGPLMAFESATGAAPSTEQGLAVLLKKDPSRGLPAPLLRSESSLLDPWGRPYRYRHPGTHNAHGWDIWSLGPEGREDGSEVIGNWDAGK